MTYLYAAGNGPLEREQLRIWRGGAEACGKGITKQIPGVGKHGRGQSTPGGGFNWEQGSFVHVTGGKAKCMDQRLRFYRPRGQRIHFSPGCSYFPELLFPFLRGEKRRGAQ